MAYLYRADLALPKRPATPAQLAALGKALAARRTCPSCGTEKPYCIPRSLGECLDCTDKVTPMNHPHAACTPAATAWQATDPVLAALRDARARRDQADRDIRILLAYARELTTPRPYRLTDLAAATGLSISGVRTAYTPADTETARHLLRVIRAAHDARHAP